MVFLMVAMLYAGGNKDTGTAGPAPIVVRAATGGSPRPFTYAGYAPRQGQTFYPPDVKIFRQNQLRRSYGIQHLVSG